MELLEQPAFVGKLLINTGTRREQYAIQAGQSLFNMALIDLQSARIFWCVTRDLMILKNLQVPYSMGTDLSATLERSPLQAGQ